MADQEQLTFDDLDEPDDLAPPSSPTMAETPEAKRPASTANVGDAPDTLRAPPPWEDRGFGDTEPPPGLTREGCP
jgi:hypothetical protein